MEEVLVEWMEFRESVDVKQHPATESEWPSHCSTMRAGDNDSDGNSNHELLTTMPVNQAGLGRLTRQG